MIFQRLRVFVSSKMRELKVALDALRVDAWVFEEDSGAPANIHLLKAAVRLLQSSGKVEKICCVL